VDDALRAELFAELLGALATTRVDDDTFAARSPDWFGPRLFGGFIVAQSVNAALQTVPAGLRLHSLHGYFLRPVNAGVDTQVRVSHVRDGRSFTARRAVTEQDGREAFVAMASFCADEPGDEYQARLDVPGPEAGATDPEWDDGPIEQRELGPSPVRGDGTMESTRRVWFGVGEIGEDPGMHTTVLAYLSDMTATSFRPRSLGEWGKHVDASLDHAVWFHRPARADGWLYYDLHALVNAGGRSVVRGELYTSDGRLCMSMAQEVLIRRL
jgi:acyl-CoA thioesterase-2